MGGHWDNISYSRFILWWQNVQDNVWNHCNTGMIQKQFIPADCCCLQSVWWYINNIQLQMNQKRNWMWEDVRDCERPRTILDCMHRRWQNGLTNGMKWLAS